MLSNENVIKNKLFNKEPLVSIVTVVYNSGNTLEETINSVINQTYLNFEYIIIDGGSSDNSIEIIKKYEKYITCWVSEPDDGIYDAMNKGIHKANGTWINFMNAGDKFTSLNTLEELTKYFMNKNNDIIYGDINIHNLYNKHIINHKIKKEIDLDFLVKYTICHQTVFFKRDLFIEFGNYDLSYNIVADYERLLTFFLKKKKFVHSETTIANYQNDGFSSRNYIRSNIERLIVLKQKKLLRTIIVLFHILNIIRGFLYNQKVKYFIKPLNIK